MPVTLDDFIRGESIAVVDIETTGFSHQEDCIVEIGICELDLNSGDCRELFDKRIQETNFSTHHRNAWIFKNSDLSYEDILDANPLDLYKERLQKIFNIYPVTAYNKRFDLDFLKDRGFVINELPCPMIIATDILKLLPRRSGTLYKWPTVEETWAFLFPERKYVEKHRSYDDVIHEALIIVELYKRNKWKPIIELNALDPR